jgi:hypothetical protein
MVFTQIGPLTSAGEVAATAIGAGILLGSFVFGTVAFLRGASRMALERRVLSDGYFGGLAALCAMVIDFMVG